MENKKLNIDNNQTDFPCACCGYLTISERTHDTFEICPVCNWEDDDVQFKNPNYRGGANENSLVEAKENYKKFGASSLKYVDHVREPHPNEIP